MDTSTCLPSRRTPSDDRRIALLRLSCFQAFELSRRAHEGVEGQPWLHSPSSLEVRAISQGLVVFRESTEEKKVRLELHKKALILTLVEACAVLRTDRKPASGRRSTSITSGKA
jgi:hypothetical protein